MPETLLLLIRTLGNEPAARCGLKRGNAILTSFLTPLCPAETLRAFTRILKVEKRKREREREAAHLGARAV